MEDDNQRQEELDCITAIFPEITLDPDAPFRAFIELPVFPEKPVHVLFTAPSGGVQLDTHPTHLLPTQAPNATADIDSHHLAYLPPIQMQITLPQGYPQMTPPQFELSVSPPWLPRSRLDELEADGTRMWEEAGHDLMVYGYIDSIQQAAEAAFGFGEEGNVLSVSAEHKIALLDFDIKAAKFAFDKETFNCGICLDPRKGSACHKMHDCGHVFCAECLQDFYNNAIKEGDLVSVQCLEPGCAKRRAETPSLKNGRKVKTQLTPSELLQIPIEHEIVSRFVHLKHKAKLETDKNTVYCPRTWCQGAARSKKYRKPEGLEDGDSSDEDDAKEAGGKGYDSKSDLLCVCEDCSLAFCSRCLQGWHGEFMSCAPPRKTDELSDEEKASLEYMNLHTTPCPTCAARAQKTHGCNHMICFKCNSHFCYLCSAWLDASNPYAHYNTSSTPCFERLWELEAGDGDDVDYGFAGGRRPVEIVPAVLGAPAPAPALAIIEPVAAVDDGPGNEPPEARVGQPEFEREGPLVMRIAALPPRAPPAVPAPPINNGRRGRNAPAVRGRGRGLANVRGGGHAQRHMAAMMRNDGLELAELEAANRAWVQQFVALAMNDEEDLLDWDSEDEQDHDAWEIPVR